MRSTDYDEDWSVDVDAPDAKREQMLSAFIDAEASLMDVDIESYKTREHWSVYQLIGDAMREPTSLAPVTAQFTSRMSAAMARESSHGESARVAGPSVAPKPASRWRQAVLAWPGLAVAGAVASVVWIAQPLFGLEQEAQQVMSVAQTEPAGNTERALERVRPESDYVSAHRQMAGPIAVRQVAFTPGAD